MQRYNPMTKCLETVKTTDSKKRRTADKGIFVKKVHKSVKSALGNTYYIVEDDRGHLWVTTDKTGNGGGTMEFSMANAVKTLKDYLKMDELEKKYGKQEGYKKWMRGEDRKTVDNDIALLINRIMKDAQKIQDVSKEMLRNKLAERIDERGRKNLNTMIVMLEKSIQELANISYRSYPFKDKKTVDAGYDSPSQMESKLKNYLAKAKMANSKQELEKINNDLFFYVAKLKSNVLKKYGTTNNKFNSTEEWDKSYSKIASKYMSEIQRLVDRY